MSEPVRLVIWDLDDTYWTGTLAEGSVTHLDASRTVVKELAGRGIISSICSKNNFELAKKTLTQDGMWDYFVFPSIDWQPKGPRIRALVKQSQLRPESVLFVDDNPSNLEEAKHFTPGIQVAGADFVHRMLSSASLSGKPDPGLERLEQYKLLEQRKHDEAQAPHGAEEFLRQSRIRVEIIHELEDKVDRIIELINRTNQLNFTKKRLPEDLSAARAELLSRLRSTETQAGIVRVVDRYGDHGYVGFYMLRYMAEVVHFCFSCRILGMGVESWLYARLGRPPLAIVEPVLTNPITDHRAIDWITAGNAMSADHEPALPLARFDWVAARGGCDLIALCHYFRVSCPDVFGEFNVGRFGFDARVDHSMFLRYACVGLATEAIRESAKLGYQPEDFTTVIARPRAGRGLIILSFGADMSVALYRHRRLGFMVPFVSPCQANHLLDARKVSLSELPDTVPDWTPAALRTLQDDYDHVGMIDEGLFKENLRIVLDALPKQTPVVLLLGNTTLRDAQLNVTHTFHEWVRFNSWVRKVARCYPNTTVVDIRDCIANEEEVADWMHFDRTVYYRLYNRLVTAAPRRSRLRRFIFPSGAWLRATLRRSKL